ncbi:nuclear transport factor 2 family protein [Desulfatibacillum aliphaticivorans]|uniref:SnoaL-like domain-containing protein n=1 Tax=Desulfatibacillum aliphaticivorans TaxID=218208 RepID=B8FI01_DESAL|nr:nuclear transport factor 2 family protein [Desulfatibacillum aliphaticivorans]ACL02568.1 hypothetical protein Dalk_0863 [Desulfatibacillum aliphaticivorans]
MHNSLMEVEQLLYRCCHAVDTGNVPGIMSVFHPDAVLIINWEENGRHEGYEEIKQWFLNYTQVMKSAMRYLRHKISCPVIEINEEQAVANSYLDVDAAPIEADRVIISVCRYEDKLAKFDGKWLLTEKSIFMDDTYMVMK